MINRDQEQREYLIKIATRFKDSIQNINQIVKQSQKSDEIITDKLEEWQVPLKELEHVMDRGSILVKLVTEQVVHAAEIALENKEAKKVMADRLASVSTLIMPSNIAEQPALLGAILFKAANSGSLWQAVKNLPVEQRLIMLEQLRDLIPMLEKEE